MVAVASAHKIHSHHKHQQDQDYSPADGDMHFNYYTNESEVHKFKAYPNTSLDGVAQENFAQHAILEKATKFNRYQDSDNTSDSEPKPEKLWKWLGIWNNNTKSMIFIQKQLLWKYWFYGNKSIKSHVFILFWTKYLSYRFCTYIYLRP